MGDIEKAAELLHIATPIVYILLVMNALLLAKNIIGNFWTKFLHKPVKWFKQQDIDTKRVDVLEKDFAEAKKEFVGALDKIREETATKLEAAREVDLCTCWEKIISLGMSAIVKGHISYSEKALFDRFYTAYHGVNGNGHVTEFKEKHVDVLPFTEDITEEEIKHLSTATLSASRVKRAQLALSNYYVLNGIE